MRIFTNQYDATETWSAQGATVLWGQGQLEPGADAGGNNFPLLMQTVQMTYSRRAQEIASINTAQNGYRKRMRIYDAPVGDLRVTSIYSPYAENLEAFFKAVSLECKNEGNQVWMQLSPFGSLQCTTDGGGEDENTGEDSNQIGLGSFFIQGVDLETMGLNIQAGQNGTGAMCSLPLVMSFTRLDWELR